MHVLSMCLAYLNTKYGIYSTYTGTYLSNRGQATIQPIPQYLEAVSMSLQVGFVNRADALYLPRTRPLGYN